VSTTAPVGRGPSGSAQPPQAAPQQVDHAAQAGLRRKRRANHHDHHRYTGDFSLLVEVVDQCLPLARRVEARPNQAHYAESVEELVGAVYSLVRISALLVARSAAIRRCAAFPVEQRGTAIKRLLSETPMPKRPQIGPAALKAGTWARVLAGLARPYSRPLGELLANAASAHQRRGSPTVSQQLEEQLRLVDTAALSLQRRLDAAETSTPVAAPARRTEPVTQAECREARLAGFWFEWPVDFDLAAEVEAICRPMARRGAAACAACPQSASLTAAIEEMVDAVHESVSEIATMVARADAAARCAHLPVDERGVARRLVMDLAQRPQRPVIADGDLMRGRWAGHLRKLAAPYAAPLAELLRADARVGGEAVSDKLDVALKRIDREALSLQRRIEAVARPKAPSTSPSPAAVTQADRARLELSRMGVALP
jgi:hypothetical protein